MAGPKEEALRHLFLAPLSQSFGEALHGVRLAQALTRRGETVVFLCTEALAPLVSDVSDVSGVSDVSDRAFKVGYLDAALPELDRAVIRLALAERCDSLVLCDLAATAKVFAAYRLNFGWLLRSGLRVAALDCWGLPEFATPAVFDYGPSPAEHEVLPSDIRYCGAAQRLFPVPFVSPHHHQQQRAGAFRSIGETLPVRLSAAQRQAARAELGISQVDRLVVFPQAGWQCSSAQRIPRLQAVAAGLPGLLLDGLGRLGSSSIALCHVGPEPLLAADLGLLSHRYRHLGPLPQESFLRLLSCADLLVSYNLAATSLGTAVASGLPTLVTPSWARGETLDEVRESLSFGSPFGVPAATPNPVLSARAESFVSQVLPYVPLFAAPLGLSRILTPVLSGNPLLQAIRTAELLDPVAITEAANALLFHESSRLALLEDQQRYLAQVALLPTADEVLLRIIT